MYMPYKLRLFKWHLFRRSEGEEILRQAYRKLYGRDLDCGNVKTFSEKMFYRMISVNRSGNAVFTKLADKYLVREYVAEKIGGDYLINLIWHGVDPKKIPFENLPEKCVIKTNHSSGRNIIVVGRPDKEKTIETVGKWLRNNFYWVSREYHYYNIKPRILIEEFVDDAETLGPLDYRFWCFNGVAEVIQVDNNVHSINPFYDASWNKLDLSYRENVLESDINKPANLKEMLLVAAKLSEDFDFVRVDLYNVKGRIFFGELTFTPMAGRFRFRPESWDMTLGQKWLLR